MAKIFLPATVTLVLTWLAQTEGSFLPERLSPASNSRKLLGYVGPMNIDAFVDYVMNCMKLHSIDPNSMYGYYRDVRLFKDAYHWSYFGSGDCMELGIFEDFTELDISKDPTVYEDYVDETRDDEYFLDACEWDYEGSGDDEHFFLDKVEANDVQYAVTGNSGTEVDSSNPLVNPTEKHWQRVKRRTPSKTSSSNQPTTTRRTSPPSTSATKLTTRFKYPSSLFKSMAKTTSPSPSATSSHQTKTMLPERSQLLQTLRALQEPLPPQENKVKSAKTLNQKVF
ncbi:hypothetical protein PoB_003135500 [Plakobranchus ocellatus]|uniref:Uncharacterized protein n=1 Tax=Plakobranchus ocellatus TaxID=259542 RepID=A0AAV4ABW1_9GAST|nr:hypothetical protein PoB_003135500 [Plakobranchus ocellatus]